MGLAVTGLGGRLWTIWKDVMMMMMGYGLLIRNTMSYSIQRFSRAFQLEGPIDSEPGVGSNHVVTH
jgi:hypothetical protein